MKILHTVELYHPSIGGMQEVVRQLSERLVRLGHDVTVATTALAERAETSIGGVKLAEFAISGNTVRGLSGEVQRYQEFLLTTEFDIIANFAAQQWATDCMLPLLDRIRAKKVFVPTGFSGLYMPAYQDYFSQMKCWLKQYDLNVFLSNDYRDINFARSSGVTKLVVIPNGAGEDEFLPEPTVEIRKHLGIPPDHFLILHVGSHTGEKGHAEAIDIFRRSRIKNATLLIAGNSFGGGCTTTCRRQAMLFGLTPTQRAYDKRLIVTSLTRPATIAAYKAADLFLFPSQIECSPLVLFESMASKTPFLTTDVGNAAEIITWSQGGRLLPTIQGAHGYCRADIAASSRMLEDLVQEPATRQAMQAAGYAAWRDRFTWERIAQQYEDAYRRLLEA